MSRLPLSLLGTVQGSYRVLSVNGSESTTGNHSPRYQVECLTCKMPNVFTKQHLRLQPQCRFCAPDTPKPQPLVGGRIGTYDVIALASVSEDSFRRRFTVRCAECGETRRMSRAQLMGSPECKCQAITDTPLTPLRRPAALAKASLVQTRESVSPATPCGAWLWLYASHPQYERFRADAPKVKRSYLAWVARQKAPDLSAATFVNLPLKGPPPCPTPSPSSASTP